LDRGAFRVGVNAAGQVVGTSFQQAFEWDHGTLTNLGGLVDNASYASWINDAGDVLGAMHLCNIAVPECEGSAVLWHHDTLTKLADLGGDEATAFGMNARGWIVGQSATASGEVHAVLWTR